MLVSVVSAATLADVSNAAGAANAAEGDASKAASGFCYGDKAGDKGAYDAALAACKAAAARAQAAAANAKSLAGQVPAGSSVTANLMADIAQRNANAAASYCDNMVACFKEELKWKWIHDPPPEKEKIKIIIDIAGGASTDGTGSAGAAAGSAAGAQGSSDAAKGSADRAAGNNGDGSLGSTVGAANAAAATAAGAATQAGALGTEAQAEADAAKAAADEAQRLAKEAEEAYKNGDSAAGDAKAAEAAKKAQEAKDHAQKAKDKADTAAAAAATAAAAAASAASAADSTAGKCPGMCECIDSSTMTLESSYGCGPKRTLLIPAKRQFSNDYNPDGIGTVMGHITLGEVQTTEPGANSGFPITQSMFTFSYTCKGTGKTGERIQVANPNPTNADCEAVCKPGQKARTEAAKNKAVIFVKECVAFMIATANQKCEELL